MIKEILKRGESLLTWRARSVCPPADDSLLAATTIDLVDTLESITAERSFTKGAGLAAPQIGVSLRVFCVKFPDGNCPVIVINPIVKYVSPESDLQYEGCLSFFDVRGRVRRHLSIEIDFKDQGWNCCSARFKKADARLVQHELDHLDGILYHQRMESSELLIPYDEYLARNLGVWNYEDD